MKKHYTQLFALLAFATVATAGAEAGIITVNTSKGERLALVGNPPASTATAAARLHQGCPAMREKKVVREYAVDSKHRILEKKAGVEQSMPGCKVSVKRDGASKQSSTTMEHPAQ